jgi:flagellar M-ring protein FliF
MAQAPGTGTAALARGFTQLSNSQKLGFLAALAAAVAVIVVALLWAGVPEHRVLYSNLSERDGGEVIGALAQLDVPYRVGEGGGVVLVPAGQVYELRLKLAAQGLPKGGAVGFELMDGQKFGISQFAEQVNYQRALAGELARSVQSMAAVQSARVHLAIPRPTVFVREAQLPSASVFVATYPGRALDAGQVAAIQHLVASSSRSCPRATSPWWISPAICSPVHPPRRPAMDSTRVAAQVPAYGRGGIRAPDREHSRADRGA